SVEKSGDNVSNSKIFHIKVSKMTTQTIQIYIDQNQLAAQKNNNYSLYLAKMVNGAYTVIWQSMGPIATVGNPSYEYSNTFDITIPSYNVNYTNSTLTPGMSF